MELKSKIRFTPRSLGVLSAAEQLASDSRLKYVGTEHIALAILAENTCVAAKALATLGVTIGAVKKEVQKILVDEPEPFKGAYSWGVEIFPKSKPTR